MSEIDWSVFLSSDFVRFEPDLGCYICLIEDGSHHRLFISRYYASKWIKENVPESGQKMWRVFELDGYFRVFRCIEYVF